MISKVHILDSANQSLQFEIWMMYKIINVEIQVHSDFGAAAKIRITKYKIPPINVAEALCMGTGKNGIIFVFWRQNVSGLTQDEKFHDVLFVHLQLHII